MNFLIETKKLRMVNHLLMKFKYNSSQSGEIWRILEIFIGNFIFLEKGKIWLKRIKMLTG